MYSAVHGGIGIAVVGVTYLLTQNEVVAMTAGSVLAFLAHDPTDRLGEKAFSSMKETLLFELPPYFVMLFFGWYCESLLMFVVAYIAGNGIDLIDKRLYLSVFFPKKYPATKYFRCHRRKPNIQLTLRGTKNAAYLSGLLIILVSLLIKFI